MTHQLSYSGDKHLGLSDIRQRQQEKLNEDAKIAEKIRKEKEREKLKEKLERYERLGWKIFGPTCEPRQEYRIENAKAKMDQKMAQARDKMQFFYDKKVSKAKSEESEKQNSEKEDLDNERKKEKLKVLKEKSLQINKARELDRIIVPEILKLRPSLLNGAQASENSSEKKSDEDIQKTKEEMDKEMKASRLKLQEKLNEAARQNFQVKP